MDERYRKFNESIKTSQKILITSHISPDPDAVSSVLLLGATLRLNFPDKSIEMVLEEEPLGLNFLEGYDRIIVAPLLGSLEQIKPDLFVILDGNNYERCSRHDGQKIREFITNNKISTAVIDHHELSGADTVDIYINDNYPATAQNVYKIVFSTFRLKKPKGYAKTAMTGLFADTGGFVYMKDGTHKEVFELAQELVDAGVNLEELKNQLSQFQDYDMKILGELIDNIGRGEAYNFSYLSDETVENWVEGGKTQIELQRSTGNFLDEYIRNIGGRKWGFIVYKNTLQGEKYYSVSLRSISGVKDVSVIANRLGGGGHKPAAGAKFEAENIKEAIEKIKQVISGAVAGD